MGRVRGVHNLTSSSTRYETPTGLGAAWLTGLAGAWLTEVAARNRTEGVWPMGFKLVIDNEFSNVAVAYPESEIFTRATNAALTAAGYERVTRLPFDYPSSSISSAVKTSATIERSSRNSRRTERREELLRRLSPERRATYERIKRLREDIGPLNFDVVEELRELREND